MTEQGHPLWEGSRVPHSCQAWPRQTSFWIVMTVLTKIFCCRNTENELKSYHNKTNWANFVWMQDSWMLLKSDSISWQKILQNSHNLQMQWLVVSTLCQETKKHLNQKVGSEGTLKLGPYWKLRPVACKVNTELRSELCLWAKTILTRGSEFLMAWISWSRIWTTMSRKPHKCSSKNMIKIECEWFCKPIKSQSKTTKTRTCWLFQKNHTYWQENLDGCWTREIFNLRFWSVEEINPSSSTWKTSTSRKRWSDWILEN